MLQRDRLPFRIISGLLLGGFALGSLATWGVLRWMGYPLQLQLGTPAFQKFFAAYQDLQTEYFRNVPQSTLLNGAIQGMVGSLGDPFTDYFTPSGATNFQKFLSGQFDGIGVTVESRGSLIQIVSVISGSPASRAGLRANDLILAVNGKSVANVPIDEVSSWITGPAGTTVEVTIERLSPDRQTLHFTVQRGVIQQPTVYDSVLSHGIGYLQITVVGANTGAQTAAAVAALKADHVKGLVIDLRGNPGGYLQQALQIAGNFIPKGDLVVRTVDRFGNATSYTSPGPGWNIPIAVLMDSDTASAAEVLSAALHDDLHAPLIGTRSFGKGTVQVTQTFADGSALKFTVAKWLTPNGTWINRVGLQPTIAVPMPGRVAPPSQPAADPQLAQAQAWLTAHGG